MEHQPDTTPTFSEHLSALVQLATANLEDSAITGYYVTNIGQFDREKTSAICRAIEPHNPAVARYILQLSEVQEGVQ